MNTSDEKALGWTLPLVFAFLSIPLLLWSQLGNNDDTQDCYNSRPDCEKDWGSGDCNSGPNKNSCPYVGRAYSGARYYGSGGAINHADRRTSNSIGTVRGGWGKTGRGFSFRGG